MSTKVCDHGHLARSCEMCEAKAEIERLRALLEEVQIEQNDFGLGGDIYIPNGGDDDWIARRDAALRGEGKP